MDLNVNNKPLANQSSSTTASSGQDPELDQEYIDRRSIIISMVHNYSNYRKVNMKALGQRKDVIGSSISSCRILSSSRGEVEAYFPALLGVSANNPEFVARVKAWLSNIQFAVNENDVAIDISFRYNKKRDYLAIKAKEDKIEEEYSRINRNDITAIETASKKRCNDLNALESTKYQFGNPINLEQYLIYRHCLLYRDVVKDVALINSDPYARFYIKDEAKEAEKKKKLIEEQKRAMKNFIELDASDAKFNAVYVTIVHQTGGNILEANLKDRTIKASVIMEYIKNNPAKFNKLVADKHIILKGFIETLISRGELIRSEYNQQISTADGQFIGANINEAVAYFNNPDNAAIKTAYENKLKLI